MKAIDTEWRSVADTKERLLTTAKRVSENKRQLRDQHVAVEKKQEELDKVLREYKTQLMTKEEIDKKASKLKEREDQMIEQEMNIRKDREGVVTMRLKMNEELRQVTMQRRVLENLRSELEALQHAGPSPGTGNK